MPQQLYAKIKKSSKYFHQNYTDENDVAVLPFEVEIVGGHPSDYIVYGGRGGCYCLRDVNLFVIVDGREIRIS